MKIRSKLSIAIVCHSIRIDGGIGRYVVELIEGLNEFGIKPVVFTKKVDNDVVTKLNCSVVRINCRIIPTKLRDYYFNFIVSRKLKKFEFDEIISANRFPLSSIIICGGTHKGFIKNMGKSPSIFDKMMINLEQKCYNNSKLVVAHAKGLEDEVVNLYGIDRNKVKTIYTPLDESRFNAKPISANDIDDFRAKFKIPIGNTTFLIPSAGNHRMKGLDILQEYFNESKLPITLLVAGRKAKEGKNVIYIGFRNDMENVYKLVDYTILSSRYEAFGMVTIESLFCGTPVVLSKNVYAQEIIDESEKILFDRDDKDSLNKAIIRAIGNKHRVKNPKVAVTQKDSIREHVRKIFAAIGYNI